MLVNHGPSQQSSKKEYKPGYKSHVTNEEVRAKIQQAIGPHKDLTIVKRRKLQWYGHVSRSSGLNKTILRGTVKGGRRQGRQRKRWEDNIKEWTGLGFGKSERAVENREKWRKLVAKSPVVPQRPWRLRDRWWWWWWWWWWSPSTRWYDSYMWNLEKNSSHFNQKLPSYPKIGTGDEINHSLKAKSKN